VEVTVLAVPGCSNAAVLEQRLAEALAGRPAVPVTRRVIADADEAARWGMAGPPTLLVDGRDPFAVPGAGPAVACRMYRVRTVAWTGRPQSERWAGSWSRPVRPASRRAGARDKVAARASGKGARIAADQPRT